MAISRPILRLNILVFLSALWLAARATTNTSFLQQSFFFKWNPPTQPVPVPVTPQCETIHIQWGRETATGPNPQAPYFLQIYTSTFIFPFIVAAGSGLSFDWAVPFAPYTQYQICMFDKNGNTGGCQGIYTVIPSLNNLSSASCPNVTFPLGPLDVNAVVENGPMSQYGWINQCTDISVTPRNGTPPYTFTIAPALHPPYNITINEMTSTNWTVSLSWASPFFISVVDSLGNFWANGPLHSGQNGPTACLAGVSATSSAPSGTHLGVTVGYGIGGIAVGLLTGIGAAYLFLRHRRRKEEREYMGSPHGTTFVRPLSASSSLYRPVPSVPLTGQLVDNSLGSSNPSSNTMMHRGGHDSVQYRIEPFVMPSEDGRLGPVPPSPTSHAHAPPASTAHDPPAQNQVYIVHHDDGPPPVTVYHQQGTEVIELPPRYIEGSNPSSDARSDGPSDTRSEGRSEGRSDRTRSEATDGPSILSQTRRPGLVSKPRATNYLDPST